MPVAGENLTNLRREIDGRSVDVTYLSPPLEVKADGSTVHNLLLATGRARFDAAGTTLNLSSWSEPKLIPLERVRRIDGGRVFPHAAWGALIGATAGALLGGFIGHQSEGPLEPGGGSCLASSPDWICYHRGDFTMLYGAVFAMALGPVGALLGSHIDPGSKWVFTSH